MADETNSIRSRSGKMPATNGSSSTFQSKDGTTKRNPPQLPTPIEFLLLLVYPTLLIFGTLFSLLSPETRAAPYDATRQSHVQNLAPSYFARKDNIFNTIFVKRGWAWITVAFFGFALTHPALSKGTRRVRAALRWALVTGWWVLITQWCFGPALIDRGFRFTGGRCVRAVEVLGVEGSVASRAELFTAVACKAAGGRWSGGHDISGHVFLLVLGTWFLVQEVGWVVVRGGGLAGRDERTIVMEDGAVKGAGVEAEQNDAQRGLGIGAKFAMAVVGLGCWMLLMTAIYFHTWFEKLTGLTVALVGIYPIYYLPRWVPVLRNIVGLPGI